MILNSRYKNDPWLYDLDWSTKPYKTKIVTQKRKKGETTVCENSTQSILELAQKRAMKNQGKVLGYPQ